MKKGIPMNKKNMKNLVDKLCSNQYAQSIPNTNAGILYSKKKCDLSKKSSLSVK
jgi:hypothetical protein